MLLMQKLNRNTRNLFAVMTLGSVLMLQGCSDDPAATYSLGGTISGLTGTVVLQNNGGSDLTITANGDFTFGANFANGTSYAVTVLTNPSGQGCTVGNGSGSVSGAAVSNITVTCVNDADPTGYYDQGTLFVNSDTTTDEGAFQAIIYNNRLMMVSIAKWLMYDGTMTIAGNEFSANATVYEDGVKTGTTTLTGTITEGVEITLGVLEGTGVMGNGTFSLTYASAETNGNTADIPKIVKTSNPGWKGALSGGDGDYAFKISTFGSLTDYQEETGGGLSRCVITGDVRALDGTAIYEALIDISLFGCATDKIKGTMHTGLAVTKTVANDTLLMLFSDGNYAGYGEHK